MSKLIHKSPLGALEIPGIGIIEPGETFEVSEERAAALLEQSDLYAAAGPEGYDALTVAELGDIADARGLEHGKKKADIIAALVADDTKGASE